MHVFLHICSKYDCDDKQVLQNILKACLQEAHNQNMATIAFPAIGTGNLGYPRDVVAEEMYQAIIDFAKENSNSCVNTVFIVVFEEDSETLQVKHFFYQLL